MDTIFNTISGTGRSTRLKSFYIEPDRVPATYDTGPGDKDFREARKYAGRGDMFFSGMHAALRSVLHET